MSSGSAFELSVVTSPAIRRPSVATVHQRPVLERLGSDDIISQTFLEDRPYLDRGLSEQTIAVGDIDKDASRPPFDRGFSENTLAVTDLDFTYKSATGHSTPVTPGFSGAVTPTDSVAAIIPTTEQLEESKALRGLRMFACCFALFLCGWNGGATGSLIPHIEKAFGFNYAQVSLLFMCTFLGYVVAALTTGHLSRRVGFGRSMTLALIVELAGNGINSSQQKYFGVMCLGFFVVGFSFSTQFGLYNTYFAQLPNPLAWTGVMHGFFGLGAFASPLVATAMVSRGIPYHYFYYTVLGMNVPALALVWAGFRNLHALPSAPGEQAPTGHSVTLATTLKSRSVWTLAIFLMLYVGAEESLGGWIVSYVIEVRKGSAESASWVASSFYLGLALGRMGLPALNVLMGERRAVFIYLVIAIALEAIAWAVPIYASTAVSTALVGLTISTFYSAAITMGGRLLPSAMHADAFAVMSSVGQSGSAFFPLIVGLISTKKGIWVVEPVVVALLGAQGLCWWAVPKVVRRID